MLVERLEKVHEVPVRAGAHPPVLQDDREDHQRRTDRDYRRPARHRRLTLFGSIPDGHRAHEPGLCYHLAARLAGGTTLADLICVKRTDDRS
jgi:hypothetical protein